VFEHLQSDLKKTRGQENYDIAVAELENTKRARSGSNGDRGGCVATFEQEKKGGQSLRQSNRTQPGRRDDGQ